MVIFSVSITIKSDVVIPQWSESSCSKCFEMELKWFSPSILISNFIENKTVLPQKSSKYNDVTVSEQF